MNDTPTTPAAGSGQSKQPDHRIGGTCDWLPTDAARGPSSAELTSLRRFRAELGVAPSTPWRWIKRGWLDQPLNIAGRLYLSREQIARFKARAAAGEFRRDIRPTRRKA